MKISKFMLRGFRQPREVIIAALGTLEREVIEEVWKHKEVSVRHVHTAFDERFAYTTLMTTLDRLYKKGLLERRKDGRSFLYSPLVSREDLGRGIATDVISGLLEGYSEKVEPVLACIVDAVSERDRNLLDELERLVQEKQREFQNLDSGKG